MAYPDKILADDEQVVRHMHPHWLTLFRPVVLFLLLVGGGAFGAALVPAGSDQGLYRLVIAVVVLVLALALVVAPLLRWRTTHYVITTHRLLFRQGVLSRTGRDIGLSRITDVSYSQTLWDRVINSGTLTIESAGDSGPTTLRAISHSDVVQQLLNHMVEEDADRRAQENAAYIGQYHRGAGNPPHVR